MPGKVYQRTGLLTNVAVVAPFLALLAALAATGFLVDLVRSYRERPRPHVAAWAVAIFMYAVATWLLLAGLRLGWSEPVFRTYYWLGAIVNVPVLAIGSIYLNFGKRAGHGSAVAMVLVALWSAWVVFRTAVDPGALAAPGIVRGSVVFVDQSPAMLARIFSPLGALVILVLSTIAVFRFWSHRRGLALGNLLIVLAILVLSVGGFRSTVAGGALLAGTLLVGAALLWAGYRVATGAPRSKEPPAAA